MLTVALGLATAVSFGAADFLGGLAARRMRAVAAAALAMTSGLVVVSLVVPFLGGEWSREALLLGALAGVIGCISTSLIYATLGVGPMTVLAPIIAVVSAVVPLAVGVAGGEVLGPLGWLGVASGLVAVVLIGLAPDRTGARVRVKGLVLAVSAGTSIGFGLVVFHLVPASAGLVPLVAQRAVSAAALGTVVGAVVLRGSRGGSRQARPSVVPAEGPRLPRPAVLALVGGVCGAIADAFMLTGIRTGELSVMAVLVALASGATVALAALVLRERLTVPQSIGLALGLACAALLALR